MHMPRSGGPGVQTVIAAQAGDTEALDSLLSSYLPLIYNIVGRGLSGHADVDDVVQETMLRAVRGLGDLRDPAAFRSWLVAVAIRQMRDHYRARQAVAAADLSDEVADPEADFVELTILRLGLSSQREETAQATRWLDAGDRELLALWWLEAAGELDRNELVAALGLPATHVAVRIGRLKEQLTTCRVVVRALRAEPPCPGLEFTVADWDGVPSPLWRKRIARHIRACERCRAQHDGLIPAERLLAGLTLVPLPGAMARAFIPPAPGTRAPGTHPPGTGAQAVHRARDRYPRARCSGGPSAQDRCPREPGAPSRGGSFAPRADPGQGGRVSASQAGRGHGRGHLRGGRRGGRGPPARGPPGRGHPARAGRPGGPAAHAGHPGSGPLVTQAGPQHPPAPQARTARSGQQRQEGRRRLGLHRGRAGPGPVGSVLVLHLVRLTRRGGQQRRRSSFRAFDLGGGERERQHSQPGARRGALPAQLQRAGHERPGEHESRPGPQPVAAADGDRAAAGQPGGSHRRGHPGRLAGPVHVRRRGARLPGQLRHAALVRVGLRYRARGQPAGELPAGRARPLPQADLADRVRAGQLRRLPADPVPQAAGRVPHRRDRDAAAAELRAALRVVRAGGHGDRRQHGPVPQRSGRHHGRPRLRGGQAAAAG